MPIHETKVSLRNRNRRLKVREGLWDLRKLGRCTKRSVKSGRHMSGSENYSNYAQACSLPGVLNHQKDRVAVLISDDSADRTSAVVIIVCYLIKHHSDATK
jgi:hypothetical protein